MSDVDVTENCRYRRERGEVVLACYQRVLVDDAPESDQMILADLLGDLLHACDLHGLSFANALRKAAVEKRCEVLAELEDSFERTAAPAE